MTISFRVNYQFLAYKKPLIIALISQERFRVEKKYWCNRIQSITGNFPIFKFAIADVMDFAGKPGMRNGELGGSSWDTSKVRFYFNLFLSRFSAAFGYYGRKRTSLSDAARIRQF
jgi:hypothetical protein